MPSLDRPVLTTVLSLQDVPDRSQPAEHADFRLSHHLLHCRLHSQPDGTSARSGQEPRFPSEVRNARAYILYYTILYYSILYYNLSEAFEAMANGLPEAMVPAGPSPTEATVVMMVAVMMMTAIMRVLVERSTLPPAAYTLCMMRAVQYIFHASSEVAGGWVGALNPKPLNPKP